MLPMRSPMPPLSHYKLGIDKPVASCTALAVVFGSPSAAARIPTCKNSACNAPRSDSVIFRDLLPCRMSSSLKVLQESVSKGTFVLS